MNKKIVRVSALIGMVIFAYIVYKIGPLQIWDNIKKITLTNFLILMLLRLFYWLLRTINWKLIFEQYEENTSLFHMCVARLCSHAVSQLNPSAQVGGEAARIFLVHSSSKKISLASVIVDKTIEYITVIFFTIIGVAITLTRIPIPGKLKILFIGFVVGATFFLLFILSKERKGLLNWIVHLMGKMKIRFKFIERNMEKVQETDKHISNFYQKHRLVFLKVFLLYSLLTLLWTAEVHLTLVFIGATDITILESFLITTLGNLAFIFPLVPASLGVYEVTYIALFALLRKETDVGFTLVLIRRILALIWAGIGLLGMLKVTPKKREKLSR